MSNIRSGQECWFTIGLLMVGLSVGAAYGQTPAGQKPSGLVLSDALTPQTTSDKVVLKVGEDSVTQGDMDALIRTLNPQVQQSIATQGRRPIGDEYATMLVLSQRALSDHLDASPSFRRTLAMQRLQLLAQAAYQKLAAENALTPGETNSYFAAHASDFDQVMIRRVVIRKKQESEKEGLGLTAEEAKVRAAAIRKVLLSGEDVKKVAQQFQIQDVVIISTEPTALRRGSLPPDIEKAAFALKDGQISQDFDYPQSTVFFQVTAHHPAELKDVSAQIENTLRQNKVKSALDELKKNAQIWMDDNYFGASVAPATSGAVKTAVQPEPGTTK